MNAAFLTPAVTLFNQDGSLDLESQGRLYNNLIDNGIDGILVQGSSSEFFALNLETRMKLAKFAIDTIDHRVKVLVGPSNMVSTEAIEFSNTVLEEGADAVVILPPYYFTFGPEALLQYYDYMARNIKGDFYIYNFPAITGYTVPADIVLKIATMYPNFKGIKDTVKEMEHTLDLIRTIKEQVPDFEIYSGYDNNFTQNVLAGGSGCISALSNIVPEVCSAWVKAFRENDIEGLAKGQQTINKLMALYDLRNPFLPILKEAIKLRGVISSSACTFPMPPANLEDDANIMRIFREAGIK